MSVINGYHAHRWDPLEIFTAPGLFFRKYNEGQNIVPAPRKSPPSAGDRPQRLLQISVVGQVLGAGGGDAEKGTCPELQMFS